MRVLLLFQTHQACPHLIVTEIAVAVVLYISHNNLFLCIVIVKIKNNKFNNFVRD